MRLVAVFVIATLFVMPAAAASSVEDVFKQFGLFGQWAPDCRQPAERKRDESLRQASDARRTHLTRS